jgi:hypothetical protein
LQLLTVVAILIGIRKKVKQNHSRWPIYERMVRVHAWSKMAYSGYATGEEKGVYRIRRHMITIGKAPDETARFLSIDSQLP